MAGQLLREAGFEDRALDTMLGIEWIECLSPSLSSCTCHPELPPRENLHYWDAVGDTTIISDKWGPSIGPAQIRALRHPNQYPFPDTLRVASLLVDPEYNAMAAWEISREGTYFYPWSAFKSGDFVPYVGEDFELHSGHVRAHLWNL
jgi:hypothetical protein